MQAVNLLPEYARTGRRWTTAGSELSSRRILPIGGIAAVGLALIFGLFYFHERSLVSSKKSELATAQARLVAQSARAEPIKQAQAANAARSTIVHSVTSSRVHWDAVLGDLGRVLPTGVSLRVSASRRRRRRWACRRPPGRPPSPWRARRTLTSGSPTSLTVSACCLGSRVCFCRRRLGVATQSTSRSTGRTSRGGGS